MSKKERLILLLLSALNFTHILDFMIMMPLGNYLMPYFLADFLKTHPRVTLQMDVTNRSKVLKSLEKNEVDFALVSILPSAIKVDTIPLIENRLFLVGPADGSVYPEPLPTTKKSTPISIWKFPLLVIPFAASTMLKMST